MGDFERPEICPPDTKPDFDPEKWGYNQEVLSNFIDQVADLNSKSKEDLREALEQGGGKAFGLKVSELVAAHFNLDGYTLEVPEWNFIPSTQGFRHGAYKGKMVRSSGLKEDWLDSRTGTLQSFRGNSLRGVAGRLAFTKQNRDRGPDRLPYVIQDEKEGPGWVVNVAYSRILKRSVVKIAGGNERMGGYTSAVNDSEASVGIWDAETGESLIATRAYAPTTHYTDGSDLAYVFKDNQNFNNPIAPAIFNAIKKVGIDFGVQLEIIQDTKTPNNLKLVQTRPSPENIFRKINLGAHNMEIPEISIMQHMFDSSLVNSRFEKYGAFINLDGDRIESYYEQGKQFLNESKYYSRSMTGEPITFQESMSSGGAVGVYTRPESYQHTSLRQPYHAPLVYLGGVYWGLGVQITPEAIMPNDVHGMVEYHQDSKAIYGYINSHCGMVSARREQIEELVKIAEQAQTGYKNIYIVSDGLIARVYFYNEIPKPLVRPEKKKRVRPSNPNYKVQ